MHQRWVVPFLLVALVLGLAACTGGAEPPGGPGGPPGGPGGPSGRGTGAPAPADFGPPGAWPAGIRVGAMTSNELLAVAAQGDRVVAVGSESADNTQRPVFLLSEDGGRSWERAPLAAQAAGPEQAVSVAWGTRGLVALGSGADGRAALWGSADGRTWERTETPEAFRDQDRVAVVRHFGDTFYAVGDNDARAGRALGRALLWTSRDGLAWSRTEVSADASLAVSGTPYARDVVSRGQQVVVLGGVENNTLTTQPNRIAIWRSRDGGGSFVRDVTSLSLAGSYRAYVTDALVEGDRILLAAMGDGADEDAEPSWDGVVVAGSLRSDGRYWETVAEPSAFGTDAEEVATTLVRAAGSWVLAGGEQGSRGDARVTAGRTLQSLRHLSGPGLRGRGDQMVNDGVATGGGAVLVGYSEAGGSRRSRVWRVSRGRLEAAKLPAGEGRPSIDTWELARAGGRWAAAGVVAGQVVAWSRPGFGTGRWRGSALVRGGTAQSEPVDLQVTGGRAVAVVRRSRGIASEMEIWTTRGGEPWRRRSGFRYGTSRYVYLLPSSVALGRRVWVVAASVYHDGNHDVLPLYSPDQGRTWRPARATTRARGWEEESGPELRPSWTAFRGRANGELDAWAVTAHGRGFVMVGSRSRAARSRAVVWRSADGVRWSDPVPLRTPPGARWVAATQVLSVGSRVVVTGQVSRSAATEDAGWMSWTSPDGGRTWSRGRVVTWEDASVAELLAAPDGLLAIGSQGPGEDRDAAVWASPDGMSWEPVTPDLPRGSGPGDQRLLDAVVVGDRLHLLGSDVPPGGGGPYTVAVPMPGRNDGS